MISWSLIWIAVGGAFGAVARYIVGLFVVFPFGTLTVNIFGSFVMGLLFIYLNYKGLDRWQPFLLIGLLGGFTTFSAFSLDTLKLYEDGRLQLDQALQSIFGKINFRGTVGAKIISDGKEIGIIPSKLVLLSKEQKLLFEKEGYVSQEFTVNPTPKLEQSIAINLMTPEETVIAAMPRRVNMHLQ